MQARGVKKIRFLGGFSRKEGDLFNTGLLTENSLHSDLI